MKAILAKHRPKNVSSEEFKASWEALGPALSPLFKVAMELREQNTKIKTDDFDVSNHYGKLVFQGGKVEMLDFLIDLLPESAKE